ncbi:Oidioi.mRNA.OKI2018_I69.PAR.g9611.t1.cds [Oikopleura dioica]|uniref:Oidioi.mRNA.OKI2018_I69.PAR.g9611.t1.cds n=1 Tax=Oikopleura dioica TaxID=34765 RepID=A0ABN7RS85_OIKDI|nr:Oidioi.mRNA.OKI2018_I69.PAR.g9611.t1.cds [Oikopleura dioica]
MNVRFSDGDNQWTCGCEKAASGDVQKVQTNETGAGIETFLYYMLPSFLIFSLLAGVLYCLQSVNFKKETKHMMEPLKVRILPKDPELK